MRRSSLPSFPRAPLSSLRARLALWYLLMLGTVLLFLGAVVFWEVRGSLYQGVEGMLEARAAAVSGQVGVGASGPRYQGQDAPAEEAETAVYLFGAHGRLQDSIARTGGCRTQSRARPSCRRVRASWPPLCAVVRAA